MPKGKREGWKQCVNQRNNQRKKKKFKGLPKQTQASDERPRETAVEVTFVGEDDVVSEQVPPPAASISSRKLPVQCSESSSDEMIDAAGEIPEGYRLISMESLKEFVKRIHSNSPCASDHLELREMQQSQFGFSSSIYANCSDCGLSEFLATGHHNTSDNGPRTVQGKDVNRRVVYAAFEMGIGKEGIAKFCEVLNMPFSMSKDTWYAHEDALHHAHSEAVQVELQKNRAEARELGIMDEGLAEDETDTVVNIPVSFDGTWSKRGYTANHGIGFVISAATGKVLDYEIISKVCKSCTQKKATLSEQEFEQWKENHN